MANETEVEAIKGSLARCLMQDKEFLDHFYKIFLASNEKIGPMFKDTDFDAQKKALRQGLNMALMYAEGKHIAINVLERIQKSHSRSNLDIPPELYPYWINSLVKAASEADPEFTPELEKQWRNVFQVAVDFIKSGY